MSRSALAVALALGVLSAPLATNGVALAADASAVATGSVIYNAAGEKIGTVTDLLTSTHGAAFAVVDVGGYVGKPKVVLCPVSRINGSGDHMTVNMTREDVQRMPAIEYNPGGAG
jgi:hypothetical protein